MRPAQIILNVLRTIFLRYELQVLNVLEGKGLTLLHTGQAADGGVDLRGKWLFPDGKPVNVVIQCKSSAKRLGPKYLRELEGTGIEQSRLLGACSRYFLERGDFFLALN